MTLFLAVSAPAALADHGEPHNDQTPQSDQASSNADDGTTNADDGSENRDENADGVGESGSANGDGNADDAGNADGDGNADGAGESDSQNADEKAENADDGDQNSSENAEGAGAEGSENSNEKSENAGDGSVNANENAGNNNEDTENSGNPGSYKLSTVGGEPLPPNTEPHLPCVFEVHFYQYDVEQVDVSFSVQPPSGAFQHLRGPDRVTLDRQNDQGLTHNGSQTYDLQGDLAAAEAERHDQQGYHIRISVTRVAESPANENNVNPKQEVFWVDCGQESAPAGEEEEEADLLVNKVVSGDAAPDADTVFTFEVTCEGQTVTVERTAGQSAWSWNANVDDDLTAGNQCSIVELSPRGAEVDVRFNGVTINEGDDVDLLAGENRFRVHNRFGAAPAADLLIDKDVDGETAPDADTVFTFEVTCEGQTVTVERTADQPQWSWNANVGELSQGDACAIIEVGENRGELVQVRFNGANSAEGQEEDLATGNNTFRVSNLYGEAAVLPEEEEGEQDVNVGGESEEGQELEVGGESIVAEEEGQELEVGGESIVAEEEDQALEVGGESIVAGEQVVAGPEVVTAGPDAEVQGVALEQRPAGAPETVTEEHGVAGQQVVAAQELPRTGVSSTALLLLAVGMLGIGGLALRRTC